MKKTISRALSGIAAFIAASPCLFAQDTIELVPSAPYDQYIIYQSLAIFWIAILGLIVLLRIKLKEIHRVQSLGIDKEEENAPFLE